jgi:hypothetical protein
MEPFPGEIGSRTSTLSQVLSTLESSGIEFLTGESPGHTLHPRPAPSERTRTIARATA